MVLLKLIGIIMLFGAIGVFLPGGGSTKGSKSKGRSNKTAVGSKKDKKYLCTLCSYSFDEDEAFYGYSNHDNDNDDNDDDDNDNDNDNGHSKVQCPVCYSDDILYV